jgi:hypothetical protein
MEPNGFIKGTIVRVFDGQIVDGLLNAPADFDLRSKYNDDEMDMEMAVCYLIDEHVQRYIDSQTHTEQPELDIQISKCMGIIIEIKTWSLDTIEIPKLEFNYNGEKYHIEFQLTTEDECMETDEQPCYYMEPGFETTSFITSIGYDGYDGYDP